MTLDQKLRVMEMIWDDLRKDPEQYESPDWHRAELEATEERRKAGLEAPIDLDEAKRRLFNR